MAATATNNGVLDRLILPNSNFSVSKEYNPEESESYLTPDEIEVQLNKKFRFTVTDLVTHESHEVIE